MASYKIATREHLKEVMEITNEAFMADAFFKVPEYHVRFSSEDVEKLFSAPSSAFVVAVDLESNVVGSLHLEMDLSKAQEVGGALIVGHFSAVAVPPKHAGKGVGAGLVQAAENILLEKALALAPSAAVVMEMGVINARKDLFPWYEKQGYSVVGPVPNTPELLRCVAEGFDIFCVLMQKKIKTRDVSESNSVV